MPRIASKHSGSTISHSHWDALSTSQGWAQLHTCTHTYSISHTQRWIFHLSFFWSDIIPLLMKVSLSAILSSSPLISLLGSLSESHLFHLCLRFSAVSTTTVAEILPRRTQPMALAVIWVVVLLGSVELAACVSVRALGCVCVGTWGGACTHVHSCLHRFVQ